MPAKRSSTTGRRVECDECGKSFRGSYELNRHRVLHSPNKSNKMHKCPYPGCPHSTLQKANLKTHVNAIHLRLKLFKCEVDGGCGADFTDGSSLIRHEKDVHKYYRNGGGFRPEKPSRRKAHSQKSSRAHVSSSRTTPHVVTALQFFDTICSTPSPSSSSSSSTSDSSFDFFTPSPSPGIPSPSAFQWEYPLHSIYHGVTGVDNPVTFDPTAFNSQIFDLFPEFGLSTPEFIQGCSGYTAMPSSSSSATPFEPQPPSLLDMASLGMFPSTSNGLPTTGYATVEAKDEWSSLFSEPTLAELRSYSSIPLSPSSTLDTDVVTEGSTFDMDFSNINNDFSQIMKELGMEDVKLEPF